MQVKQRRKQLEEVEEEVLKPATPPVETKATNEEE